ncbi:hypothetical protein [Miltoncostaea oceani]|uniref:hypothetical protein n=1 Tax=Miltoncostaea oceani TaxID=2843216 RepID=UPI001C3CEB2E|nr:hypothetical protein [Miltoncostaea oceani]
MKRIVIIIVFIFALLGIATAALALLGGSPEAAPADGLLTDAPAQAAPVEPAPPWDGRGVQQFDTTFLVSSHQIVLDRMIYGGLERPRANVAVELTVIGGFGRGKWIESAFFMNSASKRYRPARVKVVTTGRKSRVQLSFSKIPTAQLRGGISFSITYPTRDGGRKSIAVAPLAPTGPVAPAVPATPAPAPVVPGTTPAAPVAPETAPVPVAPGATTPAG